MELKQSSAVPFAVTDPISGLDITKDVQLVSIESVGEGDFPYFQSNSDYTFTVVNASRDEIVTPTTFTLDVPFDGEVHRLTATTDMTIQATQADFMKVNIIKPLGSVIVAPANSIFTIELQTSYRGIDLTADNVIIQKHKPGTPPDTAYPIKFVSATTKADGKTLDVKWQGADTMIGPFTFYVLRKGTTGLVEGEDWVQIDMNIRIGISGMRIQPIHQASGSIFGHQNELINGWFVVYKDGIPIKLNDPGLTLTLVGSTNVPNVSTVIAIDERFEDHITFKILGKPTVASNNPVSGSFYGQFDIKAGYTGSEATARVDITWVPGTDMMSTATMQQPLFANQTQKLVTQFDEVNGVNIPPWYTIEGARVRAGSIFVNQFNGGGIIQQVVVEPGTPLNSINQLVKEISASWMKQRVALSGFVLDLPFITDPTLYQTMWRLNAQTVIEMAPVDIIPNTTIIPGTAGSAMSVVLKATQKRGDEIVRVPGSWSAGSVTGAANYLQLMSTAEGDGLFRMTGKGTNGEVLLKGTFTSTADGITQPFEVRLTADASYIFEMIPKAVNVKMWDVLTEPPFSVKIDRVDAPQRITNVQVIKNAYIQGVEGKPNEWEVYRADTSVAAPSTYFTFDLVLDSGTINCVGQGTYNIATFDGVWLKPNAEYIQGDRTSKVLTLPVGGNKDFTFYPTYKGKPAADKVELAPLGGNMFIRKQVLNEAGDGVIVTVGANTSLVTTNITFTYRIKGIPEAELVDKQTKVTEWVNVQAVPKGLSVVTTNPTPTTSSLNGTLIWKPVFRWDGEPIPNNDPNITVRMIHQDTGVKKQYTTPLSATKDTTYLLITAKPPTNSSYSQYFIVDYVKDGTKYSSAETSFVFGFGGSDQAPINVTLKGQALANTNNLIPIDVAVGNNPPLDPKTIVPHGVYFKAAPEGSDAVEGKGEYVNTGHLKFTSGHMGGDVTFSMTFGSAGAPNTSVPVTFNVPAAEITVTQTVSEISGITNAVTQIGFTLSQERLIDGTKQPYNFADATIATTATVTGSVSSVTDIINTNGNFSANFVGKGDTGPGTATFKVTDPEGVVYDIEIGFEAAIDSTGFVLTLTPDTASSKKGDRLTFTGSLSLDGVNQRMDDVGLTWTTEPAGYLSMGLRNVSDVRFDVTRSTAEIENVDVYLIVKNRDGYTARHKVALEVLPNLNIIRETPKVKVWDKLTRTPFVVTDDKDIPQSITDLARLPNPNILEVTPVGTYQIVSEIPRPAGPLVVTWIYRLTTDPVGTKRRVEITYEVAEYDGQQLTFSTSGTTAYTWNVQGDFRIIPLWRGNELNTTVNYIGGGTTGENLVRYTSWAGEIGKVKMSVIGNSGLNAVKELQGFIIQIVGGYPGNANGVIEAMIPLTVYNPGIPFQMGKPKPPSITGKLGDTFTIYADAVFRGSDVTLQGRQIEPCVPNDVIEIIPGSVVGNSFDVRFLKDIDVNSNTTSVQFGFADVWDRRYAATQILDVTQLALHPKLTQAPGFESTGSGDVDNPVTLKQGVLNPE